jgi:hypothetical protein
LRDDTKSAPLADIYCVPARVCLIHVGTHKTATKSLQIFFDANKDELRKAGVHQPVMRRHHCLPGNHHLAWDLVNTGTSALLEPLLANLRETDCRTALITAEDLSLLHARPRTLKILAQRFEDAGYRPVIVVYLRAQASFAESMYVERIKHKHVRRLGDYLEAILRTGSYVQAQTPIHLVFQYTRLLQPFTEAFGRENIIVRLYDPGADQMHIYRDFLGVFAQADPQFANAALDLQVPRNRANQSFNFLKMLYAAKHALLPEQSASRKNHGEDMIRIVDAVMPGFPPELMAARFSLLTRGETLAFLETFARDNEAVAQQYGAHLRLLNQADVPPETDSRWLAARLQRAVFDLLLEQWLATA